MRPNPTQTPSTSRAKSAKQTNTTKSKEEEQMQNNENNIMMEILKELKDMRKENREFRKEITELREQITKREEDLETRQNNMENQLSNLEKKTEMQVQKLEDKLKVLEETEEYRKRREKRNNIIIKQKLHNTQEDGTISANEIKNHTKEILKKIEAEVDFSRAAYIGKDGANRDLIRVELKNFDDKMKIMSNKRKLQGQECYIDSDLTSEERRIQAEIRKKAKEEREKGKTVKIGYQKIQIDGKWENWTEGSRVKGT